MKNNKKHKKEIGLKTFFLYIFIVCSIVLFSIVIKAVSLVNQGKFDGHNLNLAIAHDHKLTGIIGFSKESDSIVFLKIKNSKISSDSTAAETGIIPDARIDSSADLANESVDSILTKIIVNNDSVKTDLTIFDIGSLIFFSKNIPKNNYKVTEVKYSKNVFDDRKTISDLFRNDKVVSENKSVEIVNSTDKSGLGNRLERNLSNIGTQVISVSTARNKTRRSVIRYSDNSYTAARIKRMLNIPLEKSKEKSIADIVIIIGEDMESTSVF